MLGTDDERGRRAKRGDLAPEVERHRRALLDFIATVEGLPDAEWNAPGGGAGWSPAQVTEHLRLSYAPVRAELAGQAGFRIRTRWWQRRLFRLAYLPKILHRGRFPRGVPATREIRPGPGPFDRRELVAAFRDEGTHFLHEVGAARTDRRAAITHPYLGRLTLFEGLRFMTQHIRHHHVQLVRSSPPV